MVAPKPETLKSEPDDNQDRVAVGFGWLWLPMQPLSHWKATGNHRRLQGCSDFQGGGYAADEASSGQMVCNGYAISATPEDRHEPELPGQLTARVRIKEVRHPAIKSGPDDDLADFAAF